MEWQQRVAGGEFRVARNQHRRKDRTFDAFVVIRVDADLFLLGAKRILTRFDRFQLVVALQIWPAPDAAVDDMWKSFSVGYLKVGRMEGVSLFE